MKEETTELVVVLTGEIVKNNLPEFKEKTLAAIRAADKPLITTQDFEDAEATVKKCKESEKALVAAKEKALNQTVDIKSLFETMDEISQELRATRLSLDKKVKIRKSERKQEIIDAGCDKLFKAIGSVADYLPEINHVMHVRTNLFRDAVSGKRKIESMEAAVDNILTFELEQLERLEAQVKTSLSTIQAANEEFPGLFPDKIELINKSTVELDAIVKSRISEYKLALKNKAEKEEREAKENKEREAAAKLKAEQEEAERKENVEAEIDKPQETEKHEAVDPLPKQEESEAYVSQSPEAKEPPTDEENDPTNENFLLTIRIAGSVEDAKKIATGVNDLIGDHVAVTKIFLEKV